LHIEAVMSLFEIRSGGVECLVDCQPLWAAFVQNQAQSAGAMAAGVAAYLQDLMAQGLAAKAAAGKLHVQQAFVAGQAAAIGFCITSLGADRVGEVEALYVVADYQGQNLGGQLFQNALAWLDREQAVEQRLVVATGNDSVLGFYAKYGFWPGFTTLFRVN
jgi:diamine N-acetyltransferase